MSLSGFNLDNPSTLIGMETTLGYAPLMKQDPCLNAPQILSKSSYSDIQKDIDASNDIIVIGQSGVSMGRVPQGNGYYCDDYGYIGQGDAGFHRSLDIMTRMYDNTTESTPGHTIDQTQMPIAGLPVHSATNSREK